MDAVYIYNILIYYIYISILYVEDNFYMTVQMSCVLPGSSIDIYYGIVKPGLLYFLWDKKCNRDTYCPASWDQRWAWKGSICVHG